MLDSDRMNILRVCYEYPPPWDGLTPGPFELSAAQVKRGHDILYLAGGRKSAPVVTRAGIRVKRLGKAWPTYAFGPFFSFDIKVPFAIRRALRAQPVDIVHVHGNTALWFDLFRVFGFFKDVPYVFHAHASGIRNFKTFWEKAGPLTKIKALFIWTMLAVQDVLTIRTADAIISVSEKDKEIFIDSYQCPSRKIVVVENGVNTANFTISPKPSNRGLNIIMPGFLRPTKNIEKVLAVVAVLVRKGLAPHLTIVGRGDEGYISKLKAQAKSLQIERNIVWRGYVSYPELPCIYAEHNLLLLLSHSEGLPKVILEAFGSGLRVVSTRSFSVTGYLNEIVSWVDETDDEETIAEAVLQAWNRSIDWDKFRREYSWEKKAEEVDRVYARVIATKIRKEPDHGASRG
jgi:glycosyltransferase involved in cell wall biosynthesis